MAWSGRSRQSLTYISPLLGLLSDNFSAYLSCSCLIFVLWGSRLLLAWDTAIHQQRRDGKCPFRPCCQNITPLPEWFILVCKGSLCLLVRGCSTARTAGNPQLAELGTRWCRDYEDRRLAGWCTPSPLGCPGWETYSSAVGLNTQPGLGDSITLCD